MIADTLRQKILDTLEENGFQHEKIKTKYDVPLETPKNRSHGHYSTNVPFMLAGALKKPPLAIAEQLCEKLRGPLFERVEAVKPGFINFTMSLSALQSVVGEILTEGKTYGKTGQAGGKRIQVEFVSANPTGPLSLGHGRLAAYGDTVATLLAETGWNVDREFYVNDAGNQIDNLTTSVQLRYRELFGETIDPEQLGYKGTYLVETAKALKEKHGDSLLGMDESEWRPLVSEFAITTMLDAQAETLKRFGVVFDNWYREHKLHKSGKVIETLETLKSRDEAYEQDGAVWFKSASFGDEKDRVLKKADGSTTYFLADIAYHNEKFQRGYDVVIDIWGADHHGYIDRMKSAMQSIGVDPDRLEILIIQFVRLKENETFVKMSKRLGTMITIDDLIDHIGNDMARFFFLTRSRESHLDFDLELAAEKSEANPLYYLQYAHARICSLVNKGKEAGFEATADTDASCLASEREQSLMKRISDYPWEIQSAARSREPHRIITFLTEIAAEFHSFYHDHRVVDPQAVEMTLARLKLSDAVRTVMANGLRLLGVSAPSSM